MRLSDFCKGTYVACPAIKSHPKYMEVLFQAAGGNLYVSESYKKQLFSGEKPFNDKLKTDLPSPIQIDDLISFFSKQIDSKKAGCIIAAFGIPESDDIDKQALAAALALQFKGIVESAPEDAPDILILEYQNRKNSTNSDALMAPMSALYPGDQYYVRETRRSSYQVNIYEKFCHTWEFENVGTQEWKGRKLFFSNHATVRPRANSNYILIPDTPPQKSVKVSVEMDARGFEGESECTWIMIDNEGNDCFPNSKAFTFTILSTFNVDRR